MIKGRHLFTSESVTEGHPDKVADQISDAVLDHVMAQDPLGRVACETLVTTGLALVAGEITTKSVIDYAFAMCVDTGNSSDVSLFTLRFYQTERFQDATSIRPAILPLSRERRP